MITQTRWMRNVMLAGLLLLPSSALAYGPANCDFDNDGEADLTIVRQDVPNNKLDWWIRLSNTGTVLTFPWGLAADFAPPNRMMCGDFDGDGLDDAAVWRSDAQATFWIRQTGGGALNIPFGITNDLPSVINDFDGDGADDLAIYRQGAQSFYWVRRSSDSAIVAMPWGISGDLPYAADYDLDGKTDLHIRRGAQHWFQFSGNGAVSQYGWGLPNDAFATVDFNGDGRADVAALRDSGSSIVWYVRDTFTGGGLFPLYGITWGSNSSDTRAPADYDGDGEADLAIWRSTTGQWWIRNSDTGTVTITGWGIDGDRAINGFAVK